MAEGVNSQLSEEGQLQSNWLDMVHPDRQDEKPLGLDLEDEGSLLYLSLYSQHAEYIKYRNLTRYSPERFL